MTGGRRRARHDDAPIGRAFADAAPGIARVPRRLHRSRRSSAKPNLLAKPGRRPGLRHAASPDIAATRARGGRTRIVERCGDPTCRHPGYPAIGPTPPPIHLASPAPRKRARRPCNDENRRRRSSSSRRGPPLRPRHRRHDVENGMNEKKKPTFAAARRKLFLPITRTT
ncbi:hypothetical protein FFM54_03380 [Burkholderia pseudomallei]|nr:hypothetical protein FFM54_03380 [Burkholderia pseudomallei]